MGQLSRKLTMATFLVLMVVANVTPASSGHSSTGQLDKTLFYIMRYSLETKTIENGQWVAKKKTEQYRIRYDHTHDRQASSMPSNFTLYTRSPLEGRAGDLCWIKNVVQARIAGEATSVCNDKIVDERPLHELLTLLGPHAAKAAQIKFQLSAKRVGAARVRVEIWLQPQHWQDLDLHEAVLATLRASMV